MHKPIDIVAIDLGASGGKCFAGRFERDMFAMQEIHRFAYEPVIRHLPDRSDRLVSRMHWDDLLIYRNLIDGLRIFQRDIGNHLDGIGIDTWGTDGMFLSSDGESLGDLYAYRDHRLDPMIDEVKALIDPARIYDITGVHFQPFNISNQLLWFARHRADMLPKGAFFLPTPSLFYFYLGGSRMVDSSWASVTQLMDARAKRWSKEILQTLGIPDSILPAIVAPGTTIGSLSDPVAADTGLNQAALIAVASHDTACAFAAAPAVNPADALIISSGTWSLVGKLIPEPITHADAMAANLSNEGGIGNIRFLKNCSGSWITQELRRGWRDADGREPSWKELDVLTETAPPFTAFIDPDDSCFYNPDDMVRAIHDFCADTGQSAPTDRGGLLRMIYESLALKYQVVNRQISDACGQASRVIHIVGGGSRNQLLNQFTANACGLPVVAGPEEATAVGNLMTQALGLGRISGFEEAIPMIRATLPIRDYQPTDAEIWQTARRRFAEILSKRTA